MAPVLRDTLYVHMCMLCMNEKCIYILGEIKLPKGAEAVVVILFLHRDEKYWPNALMFDPNRFLPKNKKNIHPHSYIPFSDGRRNCIGVYE